MVRDDGECGCGAVNNCGAIGQRERERERERVRCVGRVCRYAGILDTLALL
jgi:hypothetical protein